jgi:hypothetical protein
VVGGRKAAALRSSGQAKLPHSKGFLVNHNYHPSTPLFLVSVAAKGLRFSVSLLESTLVDAYVSVASKELVYSKSVQKAVYFVSVANRGLRLKSRLQKARTPAGMLAFPGSGAILPRKYCTLGLSFCQ